MICHRDTGPLPASVPMLRGRFPAPAASQQHKERARAGLVSPFSSPRTSPHLRCQTQTRLVLIQGVQKSPVGGLEPRCHLPRAADPGASARKDATTSFAGTVDKPLGLEPFMTPVPRASGRDCATRPHDDTTAPTAGWDPQLAG